MTKPTATKKTKKLARRTDVAPLDEATARAIPILKKELPFAYERIGDTPAKRLQWLLHFANDIDLDSLSEGRLTDLRWDVVAFGLRENPLGRSLAFWDLTARLMEMATLMKESGIETTNATMNAIMISEQGASLDLVRRFQDTMRNAFNDLFNPTSLWKVTRPGSHEYIYLPTSTAGINMPPWFHPSFIGPHDLLLIEAIDLIKAEKDRLRICQNPKCNKRIVALKKTRARFHSAQCSAYVRVNKARGKM
jgi:hypothetical protein